MFRGWIFHILALSPIMHYGCLLFLHHLYCMVSDVVEALSLVMRILTMLKRKMKLIWGSDTQGTSQT